MMRKIIDQVLESWRINNRVNLHMLKHIGDGELKLSLSKRGGRDIARQFAHMHQVRAWRMESFSKKINVDFITFEKKESPDRQKIKKALLQSCDAMERYLIYSIENEWTVSNFKRGVVPMLNYYISHEAHHRGNILLTLKESGVKLTNDLRYGIWEWNKI